MSANRLRRLARATGMEPRAEAIVSLFQRLVEPWGNKPAGVRPEWPSYIGDDHTPIEFSTTFGQKPELRILLEPLGRTPSLGSNRDVAISLLRTLSAEYAIDLGRFEQIRSLFCPADPKGIFSVWLAVAFSGNRAPDFKVYLNPAAQGRALGPALVEEALFRLGFRGAWPVISRTLLARGPELDELNYLALDLSTSPDARLKIYARHSFCSANDLENAASAAVSYRAGDVKEFLGMVAPNSDRVFDGRAPSTCYAFIGEEGDRPIAATTHFPINSYARDDGMVAKRILACHARFGIAPEAYAQSVAAFTSRALNQGVGLHSYVSFRRYRDDVRLTTYLAVEAYAPGTVEGPGPLEAESGVIEAGTHFDAGDAVADHPFCRRMLREPLDARVFSRVLANIEIAHRHDSAYVPDRNHSGERTALWIAVDREVRRASDRVAEAARRSLARLPFSVAFSSDEDPQSGGRELEPGRRLRGRLALIFGSEDAREVLGASAEGSDLAGRITTLAERSVEAQASEPVPDREPDLEDHTFTIDDIAPSRGFGSSWTGAARASRATSQFLDDLYALCYPARERQVPGAPPPPGSTTIA